MDILACHPYSYFTLTSNLRKSNWSNLKILDIQDINTYFSNGQIPPIQTTSKLEQAESAAPKNVWSTCMLNIVTASCWQLGAKPPSRMVCITSRKVFHAAERVDYIWKIAVENEKTWQLGVATNSHLTLQVEVSNYHGAIWIWCDM